MRVLLSVCIPTYNRCRELTEIIDAMCTVKRDDLEIVITDNLSTDDTRERVLAYDDPRVRYCRNEQALPPFLNMIHSIFNARGKYALYCNDRDLLYPEKVEKLMQVLEQQEVSFLYCPKNGAKSTGQLRILEQGFDSLMNQNCIHHPTGLVFHRGLIGDRLEESLYPNYVQYINTYDFLMHDLLQFGPSAIYDGGYWGTRPTEFIRKNKSGTRVYFSPEVRECMFYGVAEHVMLTNSYGLTPEQRKQVLKKIYLDFCALFCKYKACMADRDETAHYGLDTRFITMGRMLVIFNGFFGRSLDFLQEKGFEAELVRSAKQNRLCFLVEICKGCLKIDAIVLYRLLHARKG